MPDDADVPGAPPSDEADWSGQSRWAVAPGSIDNTYGRRRRPASDILADARGATKPTRSRRGNASPAPDETTGPPVDDDAHAADLDNSDTHVTSRHPPVEIATTKTSGTKTSGSKMSRSETFGTKTSGPRTAGIEAPGPKTSVTKTPATKRAGTKSSGTTPSATRFDGDLDKAEELHRSEPNPPVAVLAGFGGVILIFVATAVGTIVDVIFTGGVGVFTAILLSVGSFLAALTTRKSDLLSVLVAPPIVYALLTTLVLLLSGASFTLTTIAGSAITGFAPMAIATGIAAIIAGIKLITTRRGEHR